MGTASSCTPVHGRAACADVVLDAWQGLLDMPSFSLWLDPNPAAEPAGSLTFGGVEAGRYTGALTNITVISSKWGSSLCHAKVFVDVFVVMRGDLCSDMTCIAQRRRCR